MLKGIALSGAILIAAAQTTTAAQNNGCMSEETIKTYEDFASNTQDLEKHEEYSKIKGFQADMARYIEQIRKQKPNSMLCKRLTKDLGLTQEAIANRRKKQPKILGEHATAQNPSNLVSAPLATPEPATPSTHNAGGCKEEILNYKKILTETNGIYSQFPDDYARQAKIQNSYNQLRTFTGHASQMAQLNLDKECSELITDMQKEAKTLKEAVGDKWPTGLEIPTE